MPNSNSKSIIEKLEVYNNDFSGKVEAALARKIVIAENETVLEEVSDNLTHRDKRVRKSCVLVIDEISRIRPEMIVEYSDIMAKLLYDKNKTIAKLSLNVLAQIAHEVRDKLVMHLPKLVEYLNDNFVTNREKAYYIVATIAIDSTKAFEILYWQLKNEDQKDFPRIIEAAAQSIAKYPNQQKKQIVQLAEEKLSAFKTRQKNRINRIIKDYLLE